MDGRQIPGPIPAVHLGHDDAGQQPVDLAHVLAGQADGSSRRIPGQDRVTLPVKHHLGHAQDRDLICHDQHRLLPATERHHPALAGPFLQLAKVPWQMDREGRPLSHNAMDADETAVLLDGSMHGG
jgi:hypothetical protein